MKRGLLTLLVIIVFASTSYVFNSCKNQFESTAIITVRQYTDDGSNPAVPGCDVIIGEKENYSEKVKFKGVTDASGKLTHTWNVSAILPVVAIKDGRSGEANLTLRQGETTELTVYIK